jgi:hypothetical protein
MAISALERIYREHFQDPKWQWSNTIRVLRAGQYIPNPPSYDIKDRLRSLGYQSLVDFNRSIAPLPRDKAKTARLEAAEAISDSILPTHHYKVPFVRRLSFTDRGDTEEVRVVAGELARSLLQGALGTEDDPRIQPIVERIQADRTNSQQAALQREIRTALHAL